VNDDQDLIIDTFDPDKVVPDPPMPPVPEDRLVAMREKLIAAGVNVPQG